MCDSATASANHLLYPLGTKKLATTFLLISFFSSGQHSWLLVLGTFTHTYIMCLLLSHVHCQLICPSSQRQYLYIRFVSGMGILWRRTTGWEFFGRQNSLKNISEFRKAVSSGTMYLNIKAWFLNDLLFNFTNKTNICLLYVLVCICIY